MSEHPSTVDYDAGLFDLAEPSMRKSAELSADGLYRYALERQWDAGPVAVFVMLNPSTADATADDPTIRRCIGFAKRFGCGSLLVVNLYAYRATKPSDLWRAADPIGPDNDEWLRDVFRNASHHAWPVIAAWGANAQPRRAKFVALIARAAGVRLDALGVTKDGAPRHPLYLRSDSEPMPWTSVTAPAEKGQAR